MRMTLVMGILNMTPDSFLEPSRGNLAILDSGADIIDIGAVSTRPGAADVPEEEEWRRLEPVIQLLSRRDYKGKTLKDSKGNPSDDARERCGGTPQRDGLTTKELTISIDTTRSGIVRRVREALGRPFIVNDITAGRDDPEMLDTVAELGLPYIAMHSRGNPRTMDSLTEYPGGVVEGVLEFFEEFAETARAKGIDDWILDPGFGFAKTEEQNLELLRSLERFRRFGRPILIGIADKRFTRGETEKLHREALAHGADILRVHNVEAARKTIGDSGFTPFGLRPE